MRARAQSGFTLLEIMVVVVLIGILTSFAVMRIGGDDDRPEREARRLAAVLDAATDEAVIQAQELGLRLDDDGYTVVQLDGNGWDADAFRHDRALAPHTLPGDLALSISTDDLPGERTPGDDDDLPHILILSSGEVTPFEATIRRSGARNGAGDGAWIVTGDIDGSVAFDREEDRP